MKILCLFNPADFQVRLNGKNYPWKSLSLIEFLSQDSHEVTVGLSPHSSGRVSKPGYQLLRLRYKMHLVCGLRMLSLRNCTPMDWARTGFISSLRHEWLRVRTSFFEELLRRNGVEALVGIGLSKPEILAAQALGIPSIEVQHGVISPYFFRLNFPDFIPTGFACWFKSDEELLRQRGIEPLHVGIPSLPPSDKAFASEPQFTLVLLQYGFEKSLDGFGVCHKDLGERLMNEVSGFSPLRFRFHPVSPGYIKRLARKKLISLFPEAEFSDPKKDNLVDDLSGAQRVITYSSGSWVEASLLGKETVIVSKESLRRAELLGEGVGVPYSRPSRGFLAPISIPSQNESLLLMKKVSEFIRRKQAQG